MSIGTPTETGKNTKPTQSSLWARFTKAIDRSKPRQVETYTEIVTGPRQDLNNSPFEILPNNVQKNKGRFPEDITISHTKIKKNWSTMHLRNIKKNATENAIVTHSLKKEDDGLKNLETNVLRKTWFMNLIDLNDEAAYNDYMAQLKHPDSLHGRDNSPSCGVWDAENNIMRDNSPSWGVQDAEDNSSLDSISREYDPSEPLILRKERDGLKDPEIRTLQKEDDSNLQESHIVYSEKRDLKNKKISSFLVKKPMSDVNLQKEDDSNSMEGSNAHFVSTCVVKLKEPTSLEAMGDR